MNKCPRCTNEMLKEGYNYCPICGTLLCDEIKDAASEVLKGLLFSYKNSECEDAEEETYKTMIVGSLNAAIAALERTAQEVPVQEPLNFLNCSSDRAVYKVKIYEFYDDNGWFVRKVFVNGREVFGGDIELIHEKPTLSTAIEKPALNY